MDITQKHLQHQQTLQATAVEIANLFERQEVIQDLSKRQPGPKQDVLDTLLKRQQNAELSRKLNQLHPADIAYVLESLPHYARERLWGLVEERERGAVLLELADHVRDALLGTMPQTELIETATYLDASQLAELLPNLPHGMATELMNKLDQKQRQQLQTTLQFPKDSAGSLMDMDMATVRSGIRLSEIMTMLRSDQAKYEYVDQIYVTDSGGHYQGALELKKILFMAPDVPVDDVMDREQLTFFTDDPASEAVSAFERYDLLSAPVLNMHNQLVGNLSINRIMDHIDEQRELQQLKSVGLSEEEEVFTPVWKSAQNRWKWLGLNLITAFIASRVIGSFEQTIVQLAALAALMPIVASVGGNTGNQTVALMVRNITLNKVSVTNARQYLFKEAGVSLINGLIWGITVSLFAFLIYHDGALALVMLAAMIINLFIAAVAGTTIPYLLYLSGRDPVMGSSVLLTAITDSMGFFIFLGMASVFLIQ